MCAFRPLQSLVGLLALSALQSASPAIADHTHRHGSSYHHPSSSTHWRAPSYWRQNSNRWNAANWNRSYQHNHWNRPCGGLGCDPRTWSPQGRHPNWHRGWYGPSYYRNWGWWGPQAAAWGVGALATAAVINSAVNSASQANQTTINVPGSPYLLDYGSVQAGSSNGIRFIVSRGGQRYLMDADCSDGELNGYAPNSSAEAELLNAACAVAFGS